MRHILAFAFVAACAPLPLPPEPPVVIVDAGAGTCATACERLRVLGCPESTTPTGGRSCVETCREGVIDGLVSATWRECVTQAAERAELRHCVPAVRCRE